MNTIDVPVLLFNNDKSTNGIDEFILIIKITKYMERDSLKNEVPTGR